MNPSPGWLMRQFEAATREVESWPEWKRREAGLSHLFPPKPTTVVSVSMRMGELATSGEPGRMDAFHVPAILVRSDGTLRPKDDVRFLDDPPTRVQVCGANERHGVVDPLLKGLIPAGALVWVAIEPALIEGVLTHRFRVKLPGVAAAAPVNGSAWADRADFAARSAYAPAPAADGVPVGTADADDYDGDDPECNSKPPCVV